jgi:hypothetical protein
VARYGEDGGRSAAPKNAANHSRHIPNGAWRLNHIAKQAASACVAATKTNELLATTELPNRIKSDGNVALEQGS